MNVSLYDEFEDKEIVLNSLKSDFYNMSLDPTENRYSLILDIDNSTFNNSTNIIIKVNIKLADKTETIKEISCFKIEVQDTKPPYIRNIKNNSNFNEEKTLEFVDDESGIELTSKTFYGDLKIDYEYKEKNLIISVLRTPKNIESLKYYKVENGIESFVLNNKLKVGFNNVKTGCEYYVVATDINGNTFRSNVIKNISEEHVCEYNKKEKENEFLNNGFYDIKLVDKAGNEALYTIEINK